MKKIFIVLGIFIVVFGSLAYFSGRFVPQLPDVFRTEGNEEADEQRLQAIEDEQKALDASFNITVATFEEKLATVEQLAFTSNKNTVHFSSPFFKIYYRSPTTNIKKSKLSNVYIDFEKEETPLENADLMSDFNIVMEAILQIIDSTVTYDFNKIEPLFAVEPTGDANSEVNIIYSEQIKLTSLFNGKNVLGQQFISINITPINAN